MLKSRTLNVHDFARVIQLCESNSEYKHGQNDDDDPAGTSGFHFIALLFLYVVDIFNFSKSKSAVIFTHWGVEVSGGTLVALIIILAGGTRSTVGGSLYQGSKPPILDEPAGEGIVWSWVWSGFVCVLDRWELVSHAPSNGPVVDQDNYLGMNRERHTGRDR